MRTEQQPDRASADSEAMNTPWPRRMLRSLLLAPVWLWRATMPLRQPRCRFHPSCSSYAVEAVRTHGSGRGGVLAARRLGRCHPWNPGGVDPVPPPRATPEPGDEHGKL